jgi:NADH:ubiquinone oxidoreductase subunit 3 (subunit A)
MIFIIFSLIFTFLFFIFLMIYGIKSIGLSIFIISGIFFLILSLFYELNEGGINEEKTQ